MTFEETCRMLAALERRLATRITIVREIVAPNPDGGEPIVIVRLYSDSYLNTPREAPPSGEEETEP